MKRVCYVTTIPFTMRAFVLETALYLHANGGFDITLVCDYDEAFAASLPDAVRYVPVPMRRGVDIGGIETVFRLWRLFRREGFDLVQYSTPNASMYASIAAKLAGVPVRLYAQWGVLYVGYSGLKRTFLKAIEHATCSLSTTIEPDSRGNLVFCRSEGLYSAARSKVLWNGSASGVSLKRFDILRAPEWRRQVRAALGLRQDALVFGFVGRINRDKGIDELLEAFRTLLSAHEEAYLIMVGEPEGLDTIDSSLREWALREPQVVFCGYVHDAERYFAAMDIFVLPSYREGFGSVIIEAEAMGIPVIASDIPGPTDAVIRDQTAILVPKQDVDSLLDAMEMLAGDATMRSAMGQAGHEFAVLNFDHDVLVDHILQDRERLLGVS